MRRAAIGLAALAVAAPAASAARPPQAPGELVVRFQPGARASERAAARAAAGAHRLRALLVPGAELLHVDGGTSVEQAIAGLQRRASVRYAEPNFVRTSAATPNDTSFKDLWALQNTGQPVNGTTGTAGADLDATRAWNLTTGSSAVIVAVVDNGGSFLHPDLDGRTWTNPGETGGNKATNGLDDDGNGLVDDWRGWDFVGHDNAPFDIDGHGTHVSGIIGAEGNNGLGVTGVDWDVRLMQLRVCYASNEGCSSAASAEAFAYAGAKGAAVANVSLGSLGYSQLEDDAIHGATNTLFVVAAGNSAADVDVTPQYPCALPAPNVLCVAATDQRDALASFSNVGATAVDVAAPGTNILSTVIPKSLLLADDFESINRWNWTASASLGHWQLTTAHRVSPTHAVTAPGDVAQGGIHYLLTQAAPFSLAGRQGCAIDWWMRSQLGSGDALYLEINDGTPDSFVIERVLNVNTAGFAHFTQDLDFKEGQGNLRVQFDYLRGAGSQGEGVTVDDVEIFCHGSGQAYDFKSGTSMATPEVSGVAALVKARFPAITRTALKDAVLRSVDLIPALYPKTVAGGRVDAGSAVAIPGDVTPPTAFDLTAPANLAALADSTPDLDWSPSGDTGSGLAQYRVYVDRGAGFNLERDRILPQTTVMTPAAPLPDGTYSWFVRALDKAGNARSSSTQRSFTVDTVAPAPFQATAPADNANTQDASPVFSWQASSDSGTGILRYELIVDGTVRATVGSGTLATVPGTALAEGQHVWAIRARDAAGNQQLTAARLLRIDKTAPTAPVALAPGDGALVDTALPTFTWQPASDGAGSGIEKYVLIVDGSQNGPDLPPGSTSAQAAVPLSEGVHTWSVIAHDRVGLVGYTASRAFTVDVTAPAPAVLEAPADGALLSEATPALTWTPSASGDVDHQELLIDGTVARAGIDPATASSTPPDPLATGAHTWSVASVDGAGHSAAPPARTFTVREVAVTAGSLAPPMVGRPLPAPGAGPAAPLALRVRGTARQRLRNVVGRGLAIVVSSDRAARVTVRAQLGRRDARRVGLPKRVTAGRGSASLASARSRTVRLRLTAKTRRALRATAATARGRRALARLRLLVRADALASDGASASATRRFGLRLP